MIKRSVHCKNTVDPHPVPGADPGKDARLEFFAPAIPGTERALCDELRELGFRGVRLNRGGIPFWGDREAGWWACLSSRIAQRIQRLLIRFKAGDDTALYHGIHLVDWCRFVTPDHTLAVRAVTRARWLTHTNYAALKIKDAIVDQVRARHGRRPSVDREDADVGVFVHLVDDRCAVYLDMSGDALHRRGYRQQVGDAPLRETLAAAVLRLAGWDRVTPLIDPMCGSGTLVIEAAQWAGGRAPGLSRQRFGFERWADFSLEDALRLQAMKGELRRRERGAGPRIQAADAEARMIAAARANARAAGVRPAFRHRDVLDFQGTTQRAHVVTNPPFGARLALDPDFPRRLATVVSRWHGWRVSLLAGSPLYRKAIACPPQSVIPLRNGSLDCELLNYEIP